MSKLPRPLLSIFFTLSLCLSSSTLFAAEYDSADDYYENAISHFKKKDFATAIIQLKNALQLDENHLLSKILLGESYLGAGEADAAEVQLRRARKQGADENLVAVPIANTLLTQEKYVELEEYLSRARRAPEVDSKLLVILGISYTQRQDYKKADDAFNKAHQLNPLSAEPLLAQASLALNVDNLELVEELVSQIRLISPESSDLWLLEGDLHFRQGDQAKALQAYEKILELNPDYVTGKIRRARILLAMGKTRQVIEDLAPLWEEELYEPEAIYLYAMALARSGNTEFANQVLEEASRKIDYLGASIVDKHPSLALLSATIAYNQGESLKAMESAQKLVDKLPSHAPSRLLLARIHLDLDKPQRVIDTLKPVSHRQENNPEFLALYGRALLRLNQYSPALEHLQKAAQLSTNPKPLLTEIALANIALGENTSAMQDLQTAVNSGDYDAKSGVLLAYTKLQSGDIEGAATTTTILMSRDPDNPVLHNLLGAVFAAKNDSRNARLQFETALTLDDSYTPALLNLIKFDMKDGKLESAEKGLNLLLEKDENSLQAMSGLAQIAVKKGELDKATVLLEKLWLKHPDTLTEVIQLIDIYQRLGKMDRALTVAQELRDKNNKDFTALLTLIDAQIIAEKRDDAINTMNLSLRYSIDFSVSELLQIARKQMLVEDINGAYSTLQKCLIQKPDFVLAKIELVKLETQLRNYDKALTLADEIIRAQPDSAIGHSLKGDILVYAGKDDEALKVYNKLVEIWPSTALHLKAAQLALRAKQSKDVLLPLQSWVEKHPDDIEAKFGLAISYIETQNYQESIKLHKQLLIKLPENASIYNNLAWLLQQRQNTQQALEYARQAYQLSPLDPVVLDTYGWILSESGQSDEGLKYIRKALSRSSKDPSTRYHLALVLSRLDRAEEAQTTLKELLKSENNFRELAKAKALLARLQGESE